MGSGHSHIGGPPGIEAAPPSHPENCACTPDTEKLRTVHLIAAPTAEIIPADVVTPKFVEVVGGNFGLSDTPRNISSSLCAHTSSDSGSEPSEHQHSVLGKAYDNIKTAAKDCAADNISASTADVAGDSGNIDACAVPTLTRPLGRDRCRQSSSLVRATQLNSPRAERIGIASALLATSLGNLTLEFYHAWRDNGIMGLIETWVILIAYILDAIWAVVMRVASRATGRLVRRVFFLRGSCFTFMSGVGEVV